MKPYIVAPRARELPDGCPVFIATSAQNAADIGIACGVAIDAWTDTVAVQCPNGDVVEIEIMPQDEYEE